MTTTATTILVIAVICCVIAAIVAWACCCVSGLGEDDPTEEFTEALRRQMLDRHKDNRDAPPLTDLRVVKQHVQD